MAYTTIDKSDEYFNTKLYTGNGSTQSIVGINFQPDFVWIKNRGSVYSHQLYDVLRGATKRIFSDVTTAEETDANALTSFDSDGFSLGTNVGVNENGVNQVAWNWLAGGTGVSNTDGSITSTVSANTTSGFSIVTYTGTGANTTVGHGLGVAPKMVIIKRRDSTSYWSVYHAGLPSANYVIYLNATDVQNNDSSYFNGTAPTSTVFSLGSNSTPNASSGTYVAYCFAEKKGFSKFGSYTGNGNADGTFVYTGFKPAFVLVKLSSGIQGWGLFDNKRIGYNPRNNPLVASDSVAEYTSGFDVDILSNGFKARTTDALYNYNGGTYIYMAFAEFPIVSSSGTPCTAR